MFTLSAQDQRKKTNRVEGEGYDSRPAYCSDVFFCKLKMAFYWQSRGTNGTEVPRFKALLRCTAAPLAFCAAVSAAATAAGVLF
jgi:hypothetical protein